MTGKYKTLFFDLDHTLWDFDANAHIALREIYRTYDFASRGMATFELFQENYEHQNLLFWERFRNGHVDREALRWKRLWHTFLDFRIYDKGLAKEASEHYLKLLPYQTTLVDHAEQVLQHCQNRGYELAIITNGFKDTQNLKLKEAGIGHYFEAVVTSEDVQLVKPHPAIFNKALDLMNAKAEESLMIGDCIEADVKGAHNANMDQVFYNPKRGRVDFQPTYNITCLSDLIKML